MKNVTLFASFLVFAVGLFTLPQSASAAACTISSFNGAEVTYDFQNDTVGQTPSDVTVRSGTFEVADHSTLGKSLHPLTKSSDPDNTNDGSFASLLFDKVPTTTKNAIITFKRYNVSSSAKHSFTLRESGDKKYLGTIQPSSLATFRTDGRATFKTSGNYASSTPDYFKFAVIDDTVTLCHSSDGNSYDQVTSYTDGSPFATGTVGYEGGLSGTDPSQAYYDDITIEYETASQAGVTVTESSGSTNITEDGGTDTFDVVLDSQPSSDVTVSITSSDPTTGATTSSSTLTFTSSNWDTAQTVTVEAIDDAAEEGSHTADLSFSVSSSDNNYDGFSVPSITANITDNDVPGVTVTETGGSIAVQEGGATDTYDIVLDAQPSDDVTVSVSSADTTTGVTVSDSSLTFTPQNWDSAQTVTVTAVDDGATEGQHSVLISHTASSNDAGYDGISIADISVTVTEDEAVGVYTFESDTIDQTPSDVTVLNGSADVVNGPVLGSNVMRLNNEIQVDILLNRVAIGSTELDVRFRLNNNTSDSGGLRMKVFAESNGTGGYEWFFRENGDLKTTKYDPQIPLNNVSIPSSTDNKWRITATSSGGTTTMNAYSWDGSNWQKETTVVDTNSPHSKGGVTFRQKNASDVAYVDDITAFFKGGDVAVTSVTPNEVIQRDSETEGDIPISGTFAGSPSGIEARFNGGSWQTIDENPAGGSYSGTLTDQSVGQGDLEVRYENNTNVTDTVSNVSVGDIYVITGQSNARGKTDNDQTYSHPSLTLSQNQGGTWSQMTKDRSIWPIVATRIANNDDVPVGLIHDLAKGGTSMADWQKGGTYYSDLTTRMNQLGDVKAVLYWQGENDMKNGTAKSTYKSLLNDFVDDVQSDFDEKVVVGGTGEVNTGSASARNGVRLAQMEVWEENSNALYGPSTYDVNLSVDSLHFRTDAEAETAGNRWWEALDAHFYSGSDGRGPQFLRAEENANRDKIFVRFSESTTPIVPATGLEGFRVEDNGSPVSITSAERAADNLIELSLGSALSGTSTVSLGYGNTANGKTVPTDSTTYNLPAEVFIDESVSSPNDPTISSIAATTSSTSATISWDTDEVASTQIEYGLTNTYGTTTTETDTSTPVTSHSQTISNLTSCTEYNYRVLSRDVVGNQTTSSDNTFTTTCIGNASVNESAKASVPTVGGTALLNSGSANISLSIPNNYAVSSTVFQIKQIDRTALLSGAPAPSGKTAAGSHAYNLTSHLSATSTLTQFSKPITITITYSDSDVSGLDESSLKIYRWDGSSWNALANCSVDTAANSVSCDTTQFSEFSIFGDDEGSSDRSKNLPAQLAETVELDGNEEDDRQSDDADATDTEEDEPAADGEEMTKQERIHELRQQIQDLTQKLGRMQRDRVSLGCVFTRDLNLEMTGDDVICLQQYLNESGFRLAESGPGSPGNETRYFGPRTKRAVIRFQEAHAGSILDPVGLSNGTGYVGPSTRGFLNKKIRR